MAARVKMERGDIQKRIRFGKVKVVVSPIHGLRVSIRDGYMERRSIWVIQFNSVFLWNAVLLFFRRKNNVSQK